MGFPEGVQTVVLTGRVELVDGRAQRDTIAITPSAPRIVSTTYDLIVEGDPIPVVPDRGTGLWTIRLLANDAATFNPSGWTYGVAIGDDVPFSISLPAATSPVDLSDVAPVAEDPGVYDLVVPVSALGTAAARNVGTAAGTVAAGDDSRFGRIAGIPISGTPAAGKVPTLTSPTAGSWQTPSGSGATSTVRTASARITDHDLSGFPDLPDAPAWAVVQTSAGTALRCSIAAAADDRIRICPNFMRKGAHFLDWVILDGTGTIVYYVTTESGAAPSEGNPTMYPSTSFSYATSSDMVTVEDGWLDGDGNLTVALANQGSASFMVYAHTIYPWRLRLENIGPEPV